MDDITSFEKSYKGSEEEAETLKSAYVDCEGDMEKILEEVRESVCVCVCARQAARVVPLPSLYPFYCRAP